MPFICLSGKPKSTATSQNSKDTTFVYTPQDAKLNWEQEEMSAPVTDYDRKQWSFDEDKVKQLTGGIYGRE